MNFSCFDLLVLQSLNRDDFNKKWNNAEEKKRQLKSVLMNVRLGCKNLFLKKTAKKFFSVVIQL